MLRVTGIDHIVLRVSDVERSLDFYVNKIGLEPYRVEMWRNGEVRFPSVRVSEGTIIDLFPFDHQAEVANGNLDHYCLEADVDRAEDIVEHLNAQGIAIEEGPKRRSGARGDAMSVYIRDPDGNKLELRTYVPILGRPGAQPLATATA